MSAIPRIKGQIVSIVSIDGPHELVLPKHKPATTRLARLWVAILIWHQKREGDVRFAT